ncbi:hypothetical protein Tco_0481488 [Tanacetum coccineum]
MFALFICKGYNCKNLTAKESVRSENQANLHAGQQESNQNTGTKDKIDAGDSEKEDESDQDCFELPIWHSYSSTNSNLLHQNKIIRYTEVQERKQVFLDDLARLQRQETGSIMRRRSSQKNLKQELRTIDASYMGFISNIRWMCNSALSLWQMMKRYDVSQTTKVFLDPKNPEKVNKVFLKALYGLQNQAPRACLSCSKVFKSRQSKDLSFKCCPKEFLSDYAGANLDRKSTTGGCQFLGRRLITWQCKKQTIVALLLQTEYVAATSCLVVQWLFLIHVRSITWSHIWRSLKRSSIHHALTVSPVVSTTFVEQFWTSAKSKTINNVRHITAKVAGKSVSISEASIRSDLLFDDADGIDTLPNQAIFDSIQLMGYEGDLTVLTFNKALFSPQWRFLFHTINHCLSSKSTSWDQIPTNIATAVICLTSNQKYNFSKLIFDGMLRHLDAKKKFVMYPRFISIFLDKQLANVSVPLDHFPVNTLTSKVFSFMVKKGKHFSGKVTPLFATMLVQPTQDEGASSERPSEALPTPSPAPTSEVPHEPQTDSSPAQTSEVPFEQQTDQSPRPSPTTTIPDSIPETSGENLGGHSSSDKSLSGNEGDMTLQSVYDLCLSLCAQVSDQAKEIQHLKAQITKLKKQAKPVIKHHRAWLKNVSLQQRFTRKSFSKKHRVHKESVSKQGRKFAKGKSSVQRDPLFDKVPEDTVDHMEIKNAQMKREYSTAMEKNTLEVLEENFKVSEEHIGGTEENLEGTEEHKKGTEEEIATQATQTSIQTPTSKIFGDDETIAKVLLSNQDQAFLEKMRKLETDERDARKIKKMGRQGLRTDRLLAEKLQEQEREQFTIEKDEEKEVDYEILDRKYPIKEWKTECLGTKPQTDQAEHFEEINQNVVIRSNGQKRYFSTLMRVLSIFDREDLNAVYQLVMDRFQDETPEGFNRVLWGDLMVIKEVSFEKGSTEANAEIESLESKRHTMAKWIGFIKRLLAELEPEEKELTIPEQTATGKGTSNPLMAGSLPKTTKPT